MSGKFIVFEGTDGSGKSSMLAEAAKHLVAIEREGVFLQDPGGTSIGAQIRKTLLNPDNSEMSPLTELLLYSASRSQLVTEKLIPALEQDKVVISDRYIYSTLAYQGVSGKIPESTLKTIVTAGCSGIEPDHIILLDVPAEVGLSRVGKSMDRIESKGICYMEEVRQLYLGMMKVLPESKATIIDGTLPILEVKKKVLEAIDAVL